GPISGMEVDMVDEVFLAHAPGKIFVQNLGTLIEGLPERGELSCVEAILPGGECSLESCGRIRFTHRRCLTAEGMSQQEARLEQCGDGVFYFPFRRIVRRRRRLDLKG